MSLRFKAALLGPHEIERRKQSVSHKAARDCFTASTFTLVYTTINHVHFDKSSWSCAAGLQLTAAAESLIRASWIDRVALALARPGDSKLHGLRELAIAREVTSNSCSRSIRMKITPSTSRHRLLSRRCDPPGQVGCVVMDRDVSESELRQTLSEEHRLRGGADLQD
jgi:hypothetical protein